MLINFGPHEGPIKLECKHKLQKTNEAKTYWYVAVKISLVQGLCPWGFFLYNIDKEPQFEDSAVQIASPWLRF